MKDLFTPSEDGQLQLDVNHAEEADEKKLLAEHVESQDIPNAKIEPVNQNLNPENPGNAGHSGKFMEILRKDLCILDNHPRKDYGDKKSLKVSISQNGIISHLTICALYGGKYGIIDGVRRFLVAEELEIDPLPCNLLENIGPEEAAILAYISNTERDGFNPIEDALFYMMLHTEFGLTYQEIALKVNKTAASISNSMKLLNLAEGVKQLIREEKLTAAHGLAIAKLLTAKEQQHMAKQCLDHELSATTINLRIQRYQNKLSKKAQPKVRPRVPAGEIPGVYFGDNRNMSHIKDNSIPLAVGSPNYLFNMEFEKDISFDVHLDEIRSTCKELGRVIMPGGIVAINVCDIWNFHGPSGKSPEPYIEQMGHKYQQYLHKYGFRLTDKIVWKKPANWSPRAHKVFNADTLHTSYRLIHNYDFIYIFRKKGERELPSDDVALASKISKDEWIKWAPAVWEINTLWEQEGHPAQYPDELPSRIIKMYSYEGDMVLDPWLGSGTTIKVARELNRVGIGYERDLRYKEVIMKKLGVEPEVAVAEKSEVTMSEFAQSQLDDFVGEAGELDVQTSQGQPQPKAEFFTNDPSMLANATVEVSA